MVITIIVTVIVSDMQNVVKYSQMSMMEMNQKSERCQVDVYKVCITDLL